MAHADRKRLLTIAEQIADASPIHWNDTEELDPSSGIRQLADVVTAFRAAGHAASQQREALFTWGPLEVLELVGEGGFGQVYRAWDPTLRRHVALKLQTPGPRAWSVDSLDEARCLARVRHPNVLSVYGADLCDGRIGLWTELIDGHTMAERLTEDGTLGAAETITIGADLCAALAAIHGAGLVHGDIKASNVLRERGGRIVLADLGASTEIGYGPAMTGSPLTTAPEVLDGVPPSPSSDLYSLGALLFRMLTGVLPSTAETALELADRPPRRSLRDLRPDLPSALIRVVEKALSEEPNDRFASAGEMEAALLSVMSPQPAARRSPLRGARPVWVLLAATAVVLVLALPVLIGSWTQPTTVSPSATHEASLGPGTSTERLAARLYRTRNGMTSALAAGDSVAPGDHLHLEVALEADTHLYVVNEDLNGALFVLFPLAGLDLANPLSAGAHRLPGRRHGVVHDWQVTSAGGRETFLVVASASPLLDLQVVLDRLRAATSGQPIHARQLLRGVGGVAPASADPTISLDDIELLLKDRLNGERVWLSRIEVDNP